MKDSITWPPGINWLQQADVAEVTPSVHQVWLEEGPSEHQLSGFCWCQPTVETDVVTGDHLFIHRRSLDSPHTEESS